MMIGQRPTYWSKSTHIVEGCNWSFGVYRRLFARILNWNYILKLLDDSGATIIPWGLGNRVACIEEPYTMHGAYHTAGLRCIHEQSQCERPHHVLWSTSARSLIWKESQRRQWEESKTSTRGQCSNQQGASYGTMFNNHNWERTYFQIIWESWNSPAYRRECLLYWLRWQTVIETSSLNVTIRMSASHYHLLGMQWQSGIRHCSCLREPTDYENSPSSGSSIKNTVNTGHCSQHRLNGPLSTP